MFPEFTDRQMILYYQQLLENLISCEEFYTAQIRTVFHLLDHLMFRQRDGILRLWCSM